MEPRRLALLIACDRHENAAVQQLTAPTPDARSLAEALGDPSLGAFAVDTVVNQSSSVVARRLEAFLADCGSTDLVLLYFSGHGIKNDDGELYLATKDTDPRLLSSTALSCDLVNRLMMRSRAGTVILLLDCCYGGAFESGLVRRAGETVDVRSRFDLDDPSRGRVVITASTAVQFAFEGSEVHDRSTVTRSVFTGALTDGIRTGAADHDQNGVISLNDLYEYVYAEVRAKTPHQTPCKWEFGLRGQILIARNPRRRIAAGKLPAELLSLGTHVTPAGRGAAIIELTRLAAGEDLSVAAAARSALQELSQDDSGAVAEAAADALDQSALRVSGTAVDLGRLHPGGPAAETTLAISGGPLARASTVAVDGEGVRAWLDGSRLHVNCRATRPGPVTGAVHLSGPAGDATVTVAAEVTDPGGSPEATRTRVRPPIVVVTAAALTALAAVIVVWSPWQHDTRRDAQGSPSGSATAGAGLVPTEQAAEVPTELAAEQDCSTRKLVAMTAPEHDAVTAPAVYLSVCLQQAGNGKRKGMLKAETTTTGLHDTSVRWVVTMVNCRDQRDARSNPTGETIKRTNDQYAEMKPDFATGQHTSIATAGYQIDEPWRTQGIVEVLTTTDSRGVRWTSTPPKIFTGYTPSDCGSSSPP